MKLDTYKTIFIDYNLFTKEKIRKRKNEKKKRERTSSMRLHVDSFSLFFCLAGSFVLFVNLHARSFIWSIIGCFGHYLSQKHPISLVKKRVMDRPTDRRTD